MRTRGGKMLPTILATAASTHLDINCPPAREMANHIKSGLEFPVPTPTQHTTSRYPVRQRPGAEIFSSLSIRATRPIPSQLWIAARRSRLPSQGQRRTALGSILRVSRSLLRDTIGIFPHSEFPIASALAGASAQVYRGVEHRESARSLFRAQTTVGPAAVGLAQSPLRCNDLVPIR